VIELCSCCGLETEDADACCREPRARWAEARRQLKATYAVRDGDPDRLPMTLAEADARVIAHDRLALADEEPFLPDAALEASTWWYVPRSWIGCAGYIVEKADGTVHALGSCHDLALCFWAQTRGLLRDVGDLVVDTVADHERASATLAQVLAFPSGEHHPAWQYSSAALESALAVLPARFPRQRLWFQLPALREVLDTGAFTCRLDVAGDVPLAPQAWRVVLDAAAVHAVADDDELRAALVAAVRARRLEVFATEEHQREVSGEPGATREERRAYQRRARLVWRRVDALFGPDAADVLVTDEPATTAPAPGVRMVPLAALVAYVTGRTE
jgi:hypothetical protein